MQDVMSQESRIDNVEKPASHRKKIKVESAISHWFRVEQPAIDNDRNHNDTDTIPSGPWSTAYWHNEYCHHNPLRRGYRYCRITSATPCLMRNRWAHIDDYRWSQSMMTTKPNVPITLCLQWQHWHLQDHSRASAFWGLRRPTTASRVLHWHRATSSLWPHGIADTAFTKRTAATQTATIHIKDKHGFKRSAGSQMPKIVSFARTWEP